MFVPYEIRIDITIVVLDFFYQTFKVFWPIDGCDQVMHWHMNVYINFISEAFDDLSNIFLRYLKT